MAMGSSATGGLLRAPVLVPSPSQTVLRPASRTASPLHAVSKAQMASLEASASRPPQCVLAVHRSLAQRRMHDMGDGRVVVPLLEPTADELPFAVALELHRRGVPGHCSDCTASGIGGMDSFQLHYVLQGSAELMQGGQRVGEVRAGDSVLMTSGTAQCQVSATPPSGVAEQSEWHLAALTLVLGVCEASDAESESETGSSVDQVVVDCSAAQQVAESWRAAPEVGRLEAEAVERLVASARLTAEEAVASHRHTPATDAHDRPSSAATDLSGAASDSILSSSTGTSVGDSTSHGSARGQQLADSSSSDGNDEDGGGSATREIAAAGVPVVAAAWAAVSGAPQLVASLLRRLSRQQSVDHLEASLQQPSASTQVQRRRLRDLKAFQLPGQSNRLALVFNPLDDVGVPFTFGLEIFERNHRTPPHVHSQAHELFFILSGTGTAFCDGRSFPVAAGDIVVFPPTSVHGIDNGPDERLFCLELMLPNEMFAELVRQGIFSGALSDEDLCTLVAEECGYVKS
mmetsp:Transcript_21036/g.63289  ORF Transcript_21036/g.63289 Transcript_21036/m.63289 type:complete len:517 (+) Transcript_21036:230-1780(+)|eukprot:CAMPEP_0206139174 /NCGR_PEP_ID=MMETSP1473-20131121/4888_1 /ASSEMBLY_ACC=CAM_ASM_001109 /TAXON_ID=1461547 /ORGANISM="Stichococcus sp, Strain RCC1054" /LENGTH=516 /DNA_ID=CAMNT_0053532837 /DNA_START=164 /DNA_END=1714 /DNA_ORIENTATION=-